ncbi:flavin-containing monooxygenase [Serratia proteamaculans]
MKGENMTPYDAVVVGAGVSGLYVTHKLRNDLNLNVLAIEKGSDVGGTWFWNRYPGVQADTDSFVYRYSFQKETSTLWNIKSRYQTGSQIRDYLEEISKRNDLYSVYKFNTHVDSATYDTESNLWLIKISGGEVVTARYFISAVGVLSKPVNPKINNLDKFKGKVVHTAEWPEGMNVDGLRVGIIGTGSTGVQAIVELSKTASDLTVFQRTPQYVVPAGQREISDSDLSEYLNNFEVKWASWRKTRLACGFDENVKSASEYSHEEQEVILERAWCKGGGFEFMFGTFNDVVFNVETNEILCNFIAGKISDIVSNEETARKLTPSTLYATRPVSVDGFYEVFNKDNVHLVSVIENLIINATESGLRTADGEEHKLDIIIFATGFEAVEGAYRDLNITGKSGLSLRETWGDNPSAYLGVSTHGFPNFFSVLGPKGIFSNLAAGIEAEVNFITDIISWSLENGIKSTEASEVSLNNWSESCINIASGTVFSQVNSWIFGTNVHMDNPRVLFYFGGLGEYISILDKERRSGFSGFTHMMSHSG